MTPRVARQGFGLANRRIGASILWRPDETPRSYVTWTANDQGDVKQKEVELFRYSFSRPPQSRLEALAALVWIVRQCDPDGPDLPLLP